MASTTGDPVIETEGFTKYYGRNRGITDLDLKVPRGTIFGFLGPNGAGKTTTIRLLLDFIRPTSGSARIFGLNVRRGSLEIKRRLGYLPSEPAFYDNLTARTFLEFAGRLSASNPGHRISALAERIDLDLDRPLGQLSRGNRQKTAIVNAFMGDPELIIMDEPTTGLDPLVQWEFRKLVADTRDAGCTVFFSSHTLSEVEHLCDQVGIIRDGRLIAIRSIADLKKEAVQPLEIVFDTPVDPQKFSALPGVMSVTVAGAHLHLSVVGSLDPVIKAASGYTVIAIKSHEASLEDTFLNMFKASDHVDA